MFLLQVAAAVVRTEEQNDELHTDGKERECAAARMSRRL